MVRALEVNARVSGSMTLTRLSGVNIPLIAVFMFMDYAITVPRLLQASASTAFCARRARSLISIG